ncbi:MAG: DUF3501 family protein [bacterium]
MSRISMDDILPLERFVAERPKHLAEITRIKADRRLALGPIITLLFENRATVLWQIHEMCRVENIRELGAVKHEVETYGALLPGERELSTTLMVEVEDPGERAEWLSKLYGLHQHVRLEIDSEPSVAGRFELGREEEAGRRISAVQFVRFQLSEAQMMAILNLTRRAELVVDHPSYHARAELTGALREALVDDLLESE